MLKIQTFAVDPVEKVDKIAGKKFFHSGITRSMQSMFGASAASCTVSSYHVATVSRTVVNMVNKT